MPVLHRLLVCISAVLLVIPTLIPIPSTAQPATRLYVGHSARLTAEIPRDWMVDPTGTFDYTGADGFVADLPVTGQTLADACSSVATSGLFAVDGTIANTSWSGQAACRIDGDGQGAEISALVVPHPHPFSDSDKRFSFAAVITDPAHFESVIAALDFSPDRVTPEAYMTSVIDIVEARAYWADGIDWTLARRELLASIDGLQTVEMARGALFDIVEKLRAVGDNHSFFLPPDQTDALAEADGFGFLVGGQKVLTVYPDGPADRAGVRAGDLIEAVGDQPLSPIPNPVDPAKLSGTDPNYTTHWGLSVRLTLRRPGVPETITVTVEQGPYSRYVPPTGRSLPGDIGYIEVPHFTTLGQETDYLAAANGVIARVDQSPTCGWVIDLRLNTGGSYSPMISGIGPILGDGTFVGWRTADGRQSWVTHQDGRILDDGREVADYLDDRPAHELRLPDPPVAVLTGPLTASSGEVTALAFVGRPETRLIGEPTGGYTTANSSFSLFDGAQLGLAVSAMTDRTGATHMAGVEPDELVTIDWTAYGTDRDPVLDAAVEWLNDQPTCASREATPS